MQNEKLYVLPERGSDIIALSVRLIRDLEKNKITRDELSPEDYARLARLMDLIEDVLHDGSD